LIYAISQHHPNSAAHSFSDPMRVHDDVNLGKELIDIIIIHECWGICNNGMKRKNVRSVSVLEILAAISDEKSLNLFNSIAAKGISIDDFSNQNKLSRKQYYLRISKFIETGLIKRKDGKYILIMFGKVIHEVQLILLELVRSHWQPEAVDSLSLMKENTRKECKPVFVDHLIENAGMVPMTSTIVSSEVVK
jgi:hypothetical protein